MYTGRCINLEGRQRVLNVCCLEIELTDLPKFGEGGALLLPVPASLRYIYQFFEGGIKEALQNKVLNLIISDYFRGFLQHSSGISFPMSNL